MMGDCVQGGGRAMPTHGGHRFTACTDTRQLLGVGVCCSCADLPARVGTCAHAAACGCHTWKASPSSCAQMCSRCAHSGVLAHGHGSWLPRVLISSLLPTGGV